MSCFRKVPRKIYSKLKINFLLKRVKENNVLHINISLLSRVPKAMVLKVYWMDASSHPSVAVSPYSDAGIATGATIDIHTVLVAGYLYTPFRHQKLSLLTLWHVDLLLWLWHPQNIHHHITIAITLCITFVVRFIPILGATMPSCQLHYT